MRKAFYLVFTVIIISLVFTSCKPRKQRCPAYKSQHIIETEKLIDREGRA